MFYFVCVCDKDIVLKDVLLFTQSTYIFWGRFIRVVAPIHAFPYFHSEPRVYMVRK